MVFLLRIYFLKYFFSPCFLWVVDIVHGQNCFVFIFTNLIQVEEKTHVPVTVHFPNYAFNENMHMYCSHERDVFLIHFFLWQTQKLKNMSLLSLEIKELLLEQFLVNFVMLPAWSVALANWFASVPACMSMITWVPLTRLHLKAKFNKMVIVFIMGSIIHYTGWSSISHWRNYSKIGYNI